jgi:hypothetical protein
MPGSPFPTDRSFLRLASLGICTLYLWPNLRRLSIPLARPVRLVQSEGSLADVFMRVTAAYRAAYDQYSEGSFGSTNRVADIFLIVRTNLSGVPLSSGVHLGGVQC